MDRKEEALKAFERAIALDGQVAAYYNNRAVVLYYLKNYNDALASYKEALKVDPDNADTYNGMGNIYYHRQNWEKALKAYDHAINLAPHTSSFYRNKSGVLRWLGRNEEAELASARANMLDNAS